MRLYDEIFKNTEGMAASKCVFVPGGGGYFEGVKSVGDFSSERVLVCFSKESVLVEGKGLVIKKYYDGDLQLQGRITSVRVEESES